MRQLSIVFAILLAVGLCSVVSSVEPHESPKSVKPDPLVTKLETVQAALTESRKLVAALQRRLKSVEAEQIDALELARQRAYQLRDEISRLSEELEAVRKGAK